MHDVKPLITGRGRLLPVETPKNKQMRAAALTSLADLLDAAALRGVHGSYGVKAVVVNGDIVRLQRLIDDEVAAKNLDE